MVWCYISKTVYRQNTNIEKVYVYICERASLENFGIFTFLNCYFFQYFVGTSDTLSVQMTCLSAYYTCTDKFPNVPTNFQMYRQKSEKALLGGGGAAPPPPAPLWLR